MEKSLCWSSQGKPALLISWFINLFTQSLGTCYVLCTVLGAYDRKLKKEGCFLVLTVEEKKL